MKKILILLLASLIPSSLLALPKGRVPEPGMVKRIPTLSRGFIENRGQEAHQARYYLEAGSGVTWVTDGGLRFQRRRETTRGRSAKPRVIGDERREYEEHVVFLDFIDPSPGRRFLASIPDRGKLHFLEKGVARESRSFGLLEQENLWPGIKLKLYRLEGGIEHEFVVSPAADPKRIRFTIAGAERISIAQDGSLEIATPFDPIRLKTPFAYQTIAGKRIEVKVSFRLEGKNEVGFDLGSYDRAEPLVIDPVVYSTYLGGTSSDVALFAEVDGAGNLYVLGRSASADFPISSGAIKPTLGSTDITLTKFSPAGAPLFSTYFGGSGSDFPRAMTIDSSGDIYVAAQTSSADWPVTPDALQPTRPGGPFDCAYSKISADGASVLYGTYIGGTVGNTGDAGNDSPSEIAVDANGVVTLIGLTGSGDFPTSPGAYQTIFGGNVDIFVARFAANGELQFSTFIGGSGLDRTYLPSASVLADGRVIITGSSNSDDFPVSGNAFDATFNGQTDMVAGLLSADGASLVYSTYFGGVGDDLGGASIGMPDGSVVVAGLCGFEDCPVTSGAYSDTFYAATSSTGMLFRLPTDGSPPIFSTTLAPANPQSGFVNSNFGNSALAVNPLGELLVGYQYLSFPGNPELAVTEDAFQASKGGGLDGAVALISPDGSNLLYASYLGGSDDDGINALVADADYNFYFIGGTDSENFPVSSNAIQGANSNQFSADNFIVKISNPTPTPSATPTIDPTISVTPTSRPTPVSTATATPTTPPGLIGQISPISGGNAGSTSLIARGLGFLDGAVAILRSGATVVTADQVVVTGGSRFASLIFNLEGVPPGTYDLVITNPDGRSLTRLQAFSVVAGGQPEISAEVNGRSLIRSDTQASYSLTVRNSGNADAFLTIVSLTIPNELTFEKKYALHEPDFGAPVPGLDQPVPDLLGSEDGQSKILTLIYPYLPAGSGETLPFTLRGPIGKYALRSRVGDPLFSSLQELNQAIDAIGRTDNEAAGALSKSSNGAILSNHCLEYLLQGALTVTPFISTISKASAADLAIRTATQPAARSYFKEAYFHYFEESTKRPELVRTAVDGFANNYAAVGISLGLLGAGAAAAAVGAAPVVTAVALLSAANLIVTSFNAGVGIAENCFGRGQESSHEIEARQSLDPNDITGPAGVGAERWIEAGSTLAYRISFENQPSASLPAARVTIADALDPAVFDISSVRFVSAGFGDKMLGAIGEVGALRELVDYIPAQNLQVFIEGSADPATSTVNWSLQLIDSTTGLPPEDPLLGFLPPNTTPPAGDGHVAFTVKLKSGLGLGTLISNKASIVFDANPAIETPAWTNTLIVRSAQPLSVTAPKSFTKGAKSKKQEITLGNPAGRDPILITTLDPPDHFPLSADSCSFKVLRAGESCSLSVLYDPDSKKALSETLSIANTGSLDPLAIALKGRGAPGGLKSKRKLSPVRATKGSKKGARLVFTNTRNQPVNPTDFAPSSGFEVLTSTCGGIVGAKKRCSVDLAFRGKKPKKGKLKIFDITGKLIGSAGLAGLAR